MKRRFFPDFGDVLDVSLEEMAVIHRNYDFAFFRRGNPANFTYFLSRKVFDNYVYHLKKWLSCRQEYLPFEVLNTHGVFDFDKCARIEKTRGIT